MKGFVYAIRSHMTNKIYVGSTKQPLSMRMAQHRQALRKYTTGKKKYISSIEILTFDDAYIELIEMVEYQDKAQLRAREGHYIRTTDCVNHRVAGRSDAEYRRTNAAKIREYAATNREALNARASERVTCTCGAEHCRGDTSRHKRSKKHLATLNRIELGPVPKFGPAVIEKIP